MIYFNNMIIFDVTMITKRKDYRNNLIGYITFGDVIYELWPTLKSAANERRNRNI